MYTYVVSRCIAPMYRYTDVYICTHVVTQSNIDTSRIHMYHDVSRYSDTTRYTDTYVSPPLRPHGGSINRAVYMPQVCLACAGAPRSREGCSVAAVRAGRHRRTGMEGGGGRVRRACVCECCTQGCPSCSVRAWSAYASAPVARSVPSIPARHTPADLNYDAPYE